MLLALTTDLLIIDLPDHTLQCILLSHCAAMFGSSKELLMCKLGTRPGSSLWQQDPGIVYKNIQSKHWIVTTQSCALCCYVVMQIWSSSKELLMRKLGTQTGTSLWQHAHGIDNRQVEPPKARRSVGAEVNWGVRFSSDADAHKFLKVRCSLCC